MIFFYIVFHFFSYPLILVLFPFFVGHLRHVWTFYMSSTSRRGVYMGTRPKTRYNDLISTSINDGRRGLHSHSDSHPHSHDIPRALCRSTGVVGWHWAFTRTLQGNGGDVWGAASSRSSPVSLRYDVFFFFFLFSFFFVVYLIISPTPLSNFISLSTSCVSFLVFLLVALPFSFVFPFFSL